MIPSPSWKVFREFIGLLNYYSDIWARHPHLLNTLSCLTSSKVNFKWDEVEQKVSK